MIKRKVKFRKNLAYKPLIDLYVIRLTPRKWTPRFTFYPKDITNNGFTFLHEPYDKKDFNFCWTIYEHDLVTTFEEGTARVIMGNYEE